MAPPPFRGALACQAVEVLPKRAKRCAESPFVPFRYAQIREQRKILEECLSDSECALEDAQNMEDTFAKELLIRAAKEVGASTLFLNLECNVFVFALADAVSRSRAR